MAADGKDDCAEPGLVGGDAALLEWSGLGAGIRLDLDQAKGLGQYDGHGRTWHESVVAQQQHRRD